MSQYPVMGNGVVARQPGYEIHSDPDGLATTTETFRGYYNDMVQRLSVSTTSGLSFSRQYLASHPVFPSLQASSCKIKHMPGVLDGEMTIEFRGLDPALSYPPPPIYNIEVTTGSEPLSTNPKWTSDIAGTPTAPMGGSVWVSYDKAGANFNPAGSGGNPGTFDPTAATFYGWLNGAVFAGVEDYLAAGATFKKKYTAFSLPDLSAVGTFSDPDGPSPGLPDGYSWFYLGAVSEDNCNLYQIEESWKAEPSGPAADILYNGGSGSLSYSTYGTSGSGGGTGGGSSGGGGGSGSSGSPNSGGSNNRSGLDGSPGGNVTDPLSVGALGSNSLGGNLFGAPGSDPLGGGYVLGSNSANSGNLLDYSGVSGGDSGYASDFNSDSGDDDYYGGDD